jgi:hypothetical protein
MVEFLINCSKEDKHKTTIELEPAAGERTYNMDHVDLYEELDSPRERIIT